MDTCCLPVQRSVATVAWKTKPPAKTACSTARMAGISSSNVSSPLKPEGSYPSQGIPGLGRRTPDRRSPPRWAVGAAPDAQGRRKNLEEPWTRVVTNLSCRGAIRRHGQMVGIPQSAELRKQVLPAPIFPSPKPPQKLRAPNLNLSPNTRAMNLYDNLKNQKM